jgi:hypothetical protein
MGLECDSEDDEDSSCSDGQDDEDDNCSTANG